MWRALCALAMLAMPTFKIAELSADATHPRAYQPYGAALDLWKSHDQEVIISGPAETGKTLAALQKLDALCWKYAGYQGAIVRKTRADMTGTCLQTFEGKVLLPGGPVRPYGGANVQWYDYPNGSRLWVGGLDNPGKVLSSERDGIYANQAEELDLNDWETMLTRVTGRAGHCPHPQLMGDCNPGPPRHWIKERSSQGGPLRLLESRHEDNPTLFDPHTGLITEQGKRTLAILDSLTGTRKERLRFGRWVQAEGVIYEAFDERIHLIDRFVIPDTWRRFRVIDFGIVHPFVCQWWALGNDDRLYLYREIYRTGLTVMEHSPRIIECSKGMRIESTDCDHDVEDYTTLARCGVPNRPAIKGDVLTGIQRVQERLKERKTGSGKELPGLMLMKDSLVEVDKDLKAKHRPICTADEFGSYIWNDKSRKDEPVKENDHGMDALRYMVNRVDAGGTVTAESAVHSSGTRKQESWRSF